MKTSHIRLGGVVLLFIGLILLFAGTRKTVTLIINGKRYPVTSFDLRVVDLLSGMGITPHSADRLSLSPDTWLVNNDVVHLEQAASVVIYADGMVFNLSSTERKPSNILGIVHLRLFPGDIVQVNGIEVDPDLPLDYLTNYRVQLLRSVQLQVNTTSDVQLIITTAPTIAQALADQKLALSAADWVSGGFDATPMQNQVNDFRAARIVHLQTKMESIDYFSAAPSVGAALAEQGIALQSLDYTLPPASTALPPNGVIRLVRVSEQVLIEQEPIPFESDLLPAADVELDQRITLQAGEYGLLARRMRIRIEDGEEVSRKTEAEWIAQPVKNRIVGYGTKVVVKTLNTPSGPIEYWRSVSMYATSYSPCRIFKDRCDSYTASGAELKKGIVAMRGYWYRYYGGTQVYVPGYGVGTVADVGGGIPGRYWIDLGFSDSDYESWHQDVTVYFLTPVPDQIPYIVQ